MIPVAHSGEPKGEDTRMTEWRELVPRLEAIEEGDPITGELFTDVTRGFLLAMQEVVALQAELNVCPKCGHRQAEPNWCQECGHRPDMKPWAKAFLARIEAEKDDLQQWADEAEKEREAALEERDQARDAMAKARQERQEAEGKKSVEELLRYEAEQEREAALEENARLREALGKINGASFDSASSLRAIARRALSGGTESA